MGHGYPFLDDEAVEIIAALEGNYPAQSGATAWLVRTPEREGKGTRSTKPLGLYPTEEDALQAFSNHAIKVWETSYYYSPYAPWYQYPGKEKQGPTNSEARKTWLKGKTAEEIVSTYVYINYKNEDCDYPNDVSFYIIPLKVKRN